MIARILVGISLFVTTFAMSADSAPQDSLAIVGGTIIDVRTGAEAENSVLLITGGRITKSGILGNVSIPPGTKTVDVHGKWILPGLIDMHTHGSGKKALPLELYLANGVTTIRDVGGPVTRLRLARSDIEAGSRVGPRLFYCGNILDGMPPLSPESFIVDSPARARSAVDFLADQGADCIKVYNSIKEPELKEIVRSAKRRKLPVIGHVPRSMTMTHAVELGMQSLEHIRITGRELLSLDEANQIDFLPYAKRETLLWEKFDVHSAKMTKLLSFLATNKVFLDPTLTVDESVIVLTRKDQIASPDNQYLPAQIFHEWADESPDKIDELSDELKQQGVLGFQKRKEFIGMCARIGVQIITGTDGAGLGTLLPGFGLQHELHLLVESGLTPLQAIQAATINSAKALGKGNELGILSSGYSADVLVLGADPLKDIHNASSIELVVKGGKVFKRSDLLPTKVMN